MTTPALRIPQLPPWTVEVAQCKCDQDFQNLVINIHAFSSEFRTGKYAQIFLLMADPLEAFQTLLLDRKIPQDVMVSTLSGCIRTLLEQIIGAKSGRKKHQEFTRHTKEVSVALTTFVNGVQASIRELADRQEAGNTTNIRPSQLHTATVRALVTMKTKEELSAMIEELRLPPKDPTVQETFQNALAFYPHFTLLGVLFFAAAIASLGCSSWYADRVKSSYKTYIGPILEFLVGGVLIAVGYIKARRNLRKITKTKYGGTIQRKNTKSDSQKDALLAGSISV